jgi:hypothetical protein
MRPVRLTFNAAQAPGFTAPIPIDYMQATFNVGFGVFPSAAATGLSCSAQLCMDDQSIKREVNWTQAAQVVTITDGIQPYGMGSSNLATQQNPHGLITGDTVTIEGSGTGTLASGAPAASFDGNYAVTVTSPTQYTITVTPSQTASGVSRVIPQRWLVTPAVPAATAARLMSNSLQPSTAVRFVVAALTTGSVDFEVIQGAG